MFVPHKSIAFIHNKQIKKATQNTELLFLCYLNYYFLIPSSAMIALYLLISFFLR